MSWQLPAFALLALVLLAGFVWYERDRPPSQVVALVAALAALSVAGRIAFSPVPNVVPVTDITLITGYALGPAPGFAVGALSALISNLWLGQGPWTPWQMAGWGLVGLGGAGLAILTARRIGRIGLAAACGLAGLLYGALMDLSLMVSFGGEQSLDRYLALSAAGLPFNLAHAGGNVVFALAAGPALIAMLSRFRRRFEFTWSRAAAGGTAVPVALAIALTGTGAPGASPASTASAQPSAAAASGSALSWLRRAQGPDGGFAETPGEESSPAMTGWASLGIAAAGVNPRTVRNGGPSPIAYLKANVAEVRTIGDLERTILAVRASGQDPRDFGGRDLVAELLRYRRPNGSWPGGVNPTAFGILALAAAGKDSPASARWLGRAQTQGGGWGFAPDGAPDPDSTGAALQALAASGRGAGAIRRGVAYLRSNQRRSGGWTLLGGGVNSQSTAFAIQGLVAAGLDPSAVREGGRSPLDYLASVRAGDGHYRYSRSSDQTPIWVTAQALAAVSRRAFPLDPLPMPAAKPKRAAAASARAGGTGRARGPAATRRPKPAASAAPAVPRTRVKGAIGGEAAEVAVIGEDGAGALPWAVGGGMAALVAALVAGWFAYRRHLPTPPAE